MSRLRIALALSATSLLVLPVALARSSATVQLTIAINGKGSVRAGSYHLSCATACSKAFNVRPGTLVLKAHAAPTWKFTSWGRGCRVKTPTCTLRIQRPARVSATFVPPGDKANPIAIGKSAAVGDGWKLSILSVSSDAADQVLAVNNDNGDPANSPPPPGAQDYMLLAKVTFVGGGKGELGYLRNYMFVVGAHGVKYQTENNSCGRWPEPSFQYAPDPFSGQTLTGNVCYQIASNDAASLRFYTELKYGTQIWFALS